MSLPTEGDSSEGVNQGAPLHQWAHDGSMQSHLTQWLVHGNQEGPIRMLLGIGLLWAQKTVET